MELTRLKRSLKNSSTGREPISGNWKLRAFEWDLVPVMSKTWQSRRRAKCAQKVNHLIKKIKAPNLLLTYETVKFAFRIEKGLLGSSRVQGVQVNWLWKKGYQPFLVCHCSYKNAKREYAFVFEYAETATATSAFRLSIVKAWNGYLTMQNWCMVASINMVSDYW